MRIRFLVSGGAGIGLGHVMRTAVLAAEARRLGHGVSVAIRGDAAARTALSGELPACAIETWADPAAAVASAGALVIDSPDDVSRELSAARRNGIRSLVVDRLEYLDAADATVLPILHGPPIEHPRLFQGARFVALSTAVRTFASSPYPEGRTVGLVTIGGADPLGLTIPLASAAKAALSATGHTTPLHAIVGPAFKDGDSVARQLLDSGIEVHRGLSRADVVQWMAHSRFALSGFGTSIYDLAALGTPVVYWTHRSQDLPAALRLEERGLGACGGNGGSIDSGDAEAVLRRTVCNDEWCRVASDRGRELVRAADGARAVVELLASPWAA